MWTCYLIINAVAIGPCLPLFQTWLMCARWTGTACRRPTSAPGRHAATWPAPIRPADTAVGRTCATTVQRNRGWKNPARSTHLKALPRFQSDSTAKSVRTSCRVTRASLTSVLTRPYQRRSRYHVRRHICASPRLYSVQVQSCVFKYCMNQCPSCLNNLWTNDRHCKHSLETFPPGIFIRIRILNTITGYGRSPWPSVTNLFQSPGGACSVPAAT